jgi:AraC-like DNA-binding protein
MILKTTFSSDVFREMPYNNDHKYKLLKKAGARKMKGRQREIDEVIMYIHRNIHDPISLDLLANHVGYSPYHFSRIFKKYMGISPLYYVSSLRLQKAKEMLLQTNLTVRDIGLEVGQKSLGTFTTRFTERVGVSPSQFRRSISEADNHLHSLQTLSEWHPLSSGNHSNFVRGTVMAEVPFSGVIFIGLFEKSILEGLPLYGTVLSSLGEYMFTDVKPGTYYLMATAVSWETEATDILLPHTTLRARSIHPIIVQNVMPIPQQNLTLHGPRLDDPPILISLPLLMNNFMNTMNLR